LPGIVDATLRVETPLPPVDRVTREGLREAVAPTMDIVDVKLTGPEKLLRLARKIEDELDDPDKTTSELGLAVMAKSGAAPTVIDTVTECSKIPLAPLKVTV